MSQDMVDATNSEVRMSATARYIVDAVVLEKRSPTELAQTHKVSRAWIYKMLKRFQAGGYAALTPRSRRPHSCPHQVDLKVQKLILKLRCCGPRCRRTMQ